jgi:hypothetical protein
MEVRCRRFWRCDLRDHTGKVPLEVVSVGRACLISALYLPPIPPLLLPPRERPNGHQTDKTERHLLRLYVCCALE